MSRPRNLEEKVVLNLWIPLSVRARVDLLLVSELEGRVPKGAYSEFFTERAREFYDWPVLQLEPFGFPPGYFVKGPPDMIARLKSRLEVVI